MLPPIEFFMGMLAGGLLGYFLAIMASGGEAGVRAAEHDTRHDESRLD